VALWWTNFSWWQKQRLSIARAIARKPEILIFDDSFSALDYKTDLKLRKNLNKLLKWSTIFIVAQRIGTIKNADKILVIEDWKCVWIWKHEELLKNCKVYKEIALSQLSEQELNNQK
jgi:ATP-binding cassette subfamily B protein